MINEQLITGTVSGNGYLFKGELSLTKDGKLEVSVEKDGKVYEINLLTPVSGTVIIDAETEDNAKALKVNTEFNSSVSLAQDTENKLTGNSARVTLSGYDFADYVQNGEYDVDQLNSAYQPSVKFGVIKNGKDLTKISSIEFYVYNEQTEDITIDIFLEKQDNGVSTQVSYDKVTLYANTWTKVVVDNFNVFGVG